jgi:hypothetical protein
MAIPALVPETSGQELGNVVDQLARLLTVDAGEIVARYFPQCDAVPGIRSLRVWVRPMNDTLLTIGQKLGALIAAPSRWCCGRRHAPGRSVSQRGDDLHI